MRSVDVAAGFPEGTTGTEVSRSDLAIDWLERIILVVVYAFFASRIMSRSIASDAYGSLLILPAEGVAVALMLFRRTTAHVSRRLSVWAVAFGAAVSPMLVSTGGHSLLRADVGSFILVVGIVVQLHAKITLGRSFGWVPSHRGLEVRGPYRLVRHPMYLGYLIAHVAFLLMNPTAWNALAYAVLYALQIPRLLLEEQVLSSDPAYRAYAAEVRHRLIPGVF